MSFVIKELLCAKDMAFCFNRLIIQCMQSAIIWGQLQPLYDCDMADVQMPSVTTETSFYGGSRERRASSDSVKHGANSVKGDGPP